MTPPIDPVPDPSPTPREETMRIAVSELEESRRALDAARVELNDPKLVAEMERLVAARSEVVERLQGTARASDFDGRRAEAPARSIQRAAQVAQAEVIETLIRQETTTIGALRRSLEAPLPRSVEAPLRTALTQVGRTRDQLQLVAR